MRSSAGSFDNFGFRVDQVVFDEVQTCFNVSVFKLDEVQACSDLLLHRYLIQLVTGSILGNKWDTHVQSTLKTQFNQNKAGEDGSLVCFFGKSLIVHSSVYYSWRRRVGFKNPFVQVTKVNWEKYKEIKNFWHQFRFFRVYYQFSINQMFRVQFSQQSGPWTYYVWEIFFIIIFIVFLHRFPLPLLDLDSCLLWLKKLNIVDVKYC